MIESYSTMPNSYWKEHQIAGCALSIIVNYDHFDTNHTYKEITGDYTFSTHDSDGDVWKRQKPERQKKRHL